MNQLQARVPGFLCAVQAADSGSFSAAARVLDLTPAAVSKNVANLEALLGLRLFNRSTRQVAPTAEGARVIEQARAALRALDAAGTVGRDASAAAGLVRVSCSAGFGRRFVLPLTAELAERLPGIRLELSLNDLPVDLVREGFDVGIRGALEPPQGMVARPVCRVPTVLVATPRYLRAHGTPQDFSALAAHRLLGVRFLSGRIGSWHFKLAGKPVAYVPAAQLLVSDPEALLDAALRHQGIAQVGLHHAWAALQAGQLRPLLLDQHQPSELTVSIFYPHRAGIAPRVRAVVEFLLERLRQEPALAASRAALGATVAASARTAR